MEQTFFTHVNIKKIRHLKDISIPLDKKQRKHLILTGKNGSGKTSVLEAMVNYVNVSFYEKAMTLKHAEKMYNNSLNAVNDLESKNDSEENRQRIYEAKNTLKLWENELKKFDVGIVINSTSDTLLKEKYSQGNFIFAYYEAERELRLEAYKNIEKVELQNKYSIKENPGAKFTKYLVDLKATQAFSKDKAKTEKIEKWFNSFEDILKKIFEDDDLELEFNDETFQFYICASGREAFDFNTMSSGYAAIFDIINDLIIRMEAQSGLRTEFDMEGVVFVDEIETHLHLELQKKILPILTKLFPNIQFIITTHSPFILSSLDNAVIYDLENGTFVKEGLRNLPYEGIVEGYFKADLLSEELRDEEYEEIDDLEFYLDEIPDYLAKELTAEYNRLKLEFANRG